LPNKFKTEAISKDIDSNVDTKESNIVTISIYNIEITVYIDYK